MWLGAQRTFPGGMKSTWPALRLGNRSGERRREKEVLGEKMGSWNSCLIASNLLDIQGKAGGWRRGYVVGGRIVVWEGLILGC